MTERHLIDKSAFARWGKPAVRAAIRPLHDAGLLAVCGAVEAGLLYSVRSRRDAQQVREELTGFDWLPTPDEVWDRVLDMQQRLIDTGNWRAVSLPDLVIAATAERHGAVVLHYDGDYDMIAAVTGQPTRWVVPRGTAD
ncbi:PIN domain nuclease [Streptomyces sp. DSM 42041]|uniref:Ribonuclease VapC n=1 Tax=Streptomyces hazeniae TaxID=3075538 RepID=A0ABU2NL27_9ACTN|nr:PIN domain nuclease [Streptomyces sp. DSM 42041]MDT0377623.1 PIN domain nuclease [Streptomyces sp. DSM 42041]